MKLYKSFICFLFLIFTFFCWGNEAVSIFHYVDYGALVFDLPKNRVILLSEDTELFQKALEKLQSGEERKLRQLIQQLNHVAVLINSGDSLQREKTFALLSSDYNESEYEGEIAFKKINKKIEIELPLLFATVNERDQRELVVAGVYALDQLEQLKAVDEIACAFREFDQDHEIFKKGDWFDYALACYFSGKLTDGELCALSELSTLIAYQQPDSVVDVEIVDLDSKKGEKFFLEFYKGVLKENPFSIYQRLLAEIADQSRLEKLIFRIQFSEKPKMLTFNEFVLRGMCYHRDRYLIHLMPFTFHTLLTMHFGDNVQGLSACFGYSEDLTYWRYDQRPISIPCTRIPIMTCVHDQEVSHPIEMLVHDTAHQIICCYIPKEHRNIFRQIANALEVKLQNTQYREELVAICNYFYDMPFLYYLREDIEPPLAFYTAFVVAIYRTLSTKWHNSYIDEIIKLARYQKANSLIKNVFIECDMYLEKGLLSEGMISQLGGDKEAVNFLKNSLLTILERLDYFPE